MNYQNLTALDMGIAASLILVNGAHRGATVGHRLPAGMGVRVRLLVCGTAVDVRNDPDRRAVGGGAWASHVPWAKGRQHPSSCRDCLQENPTLRSLLRT